MAAHVTTGLTPQGVTLIKTILDSLEAEFPYLFKLNDKEKSALNPVGDNRFPFVEKASTYAADHPNLMPPICPVPVFLQVKFDFESISYVIGRLEQLLEGLRDTNMQISSNYFDHSLLFYKMVSVAADAGKPGMGVIHKDLNELFYRKPKSDDNSSNGNTSGDNSSGDGQPTDNNPPT